jgi:raffinose/stachyose/melibiose transport system substrate-binding protein
MKRLLAVVSVLVMLVPGIFASGTKEAVADTGKTQIRLMHFFTEGDARHGVIVKVLDQFAQDNPDIEVLVDEMAHDLYQTKVQTLGAANQLPDVFFMKGNWAELFSASDSIAPVDDILAQDPAWKDSLLESALANHLYDGKLYSIPYTMDLNSLIYYNGALFENYGLEFPKTWEALEHCISVFKQNGVTPIALGNKDQWLVPTGWLSVLTALFGGPDYMNSLCFGDESYETSGYIQALKAMRRLVELGAFNVDYNSIDNYQMYALYGQGNTAMFSAGSWAASTLMESVPSEIIHVTKVGVVPSVNGKGSYFTTAGGSGWGVNINKELSGEKRIAAIKLMKALTDVHFGKTLLEVAQMPPAVKGVEIDTSIVSQLFQDILAVQQKAIITPVFDQVIAPELIDEQNRTTQAVMVGSMTAEEAASRMQAIKVRLAQK